METNFQFFFQFVGRKTWKFHSGGEKMRNDSGHQGENGRLWRTSEQEQTQHFLHKPCKGEVSRLSNAKKSVLQKQSFFLLITPFLLLLLFF